jgi:hypothetical protein
MLRGWRLDRPLDHWVPVLVLVDVAVLVHAFLVASVALI